MPEVSAFVPPTIDDADIAWVCEKLRLPLNAFSGADGNDPRQSILKSDAVLDVEACPGSGKTTLLVAKLAMLASKWSNSRRGVCVLSHTNVARRQIEESLGSTPEGRRLLAYPHYIGTIHGFINEFLAVPWLRSQKFPATTIDDQQCEQHRRRLLQLAQFSALRGYVQNKEANSQTKVVSGWHVADPTFKVVKNNGQPEFSGAKPAANQLVELARKCAQDGYHRYGEMFMWAHDLLGKYPNVATALRHRFPMLFIDEVQDNNEAQAALLHRIFMEGEKVVVRQRYGDSNQAIYNHADEKAAESDVFPQDEVRRDVPNSLRFGQQVANFADPLALVPPGLIGQGPSSPRIASATQDKHAILLFGDDTIGHVLPRYAAYLTELFTEAERRIGTFTAVGAVHRPSGNDQVPRHVGHYWPAYDYQISSSEPKPATFYQYVTAGRKGTGETGEAHYSVEKIAEGIIRTIRLANWAARLPSRRRKHDQILEQLQTDLELRARYLNLILELSDPERGLETERWESIWRPAVLDVAAALAKTAVSEAIASQFLSWPSAGPEGESTRPRGDNFFRGEFIGDLAIRVGSIHGAKGENSYGDASARHLLLWPQPATLKALAFGTECRQGCCRCAGPDALEAALRGDDTTYASPLPCDERHFRAAGNSHSEGERLAGGTDHHHSHYMALKFVIPGDERTTLAGVSFGVLIGSSTSANSTRRTLPSLIARVAALPSVRSTAASAIPRALRLLRWTR